LKPERWGSLLVQEKYQEEKACDKRHSVLYNNNNNNEKLKDKFGSCTRETLDRFTTKDSYTWNNTHNTEKTAV